MTSSRRPLATTSNNNAASNNTPDDYPASNAHGSGTSSGGNTAPFHLRYNRKPQYLTLANALFFFGVALMLNVYVMLTVHQFQESYETPNIMTMDIPRNDTSKTRPSLAVVSACLPGPRFPPRYIELSHRNKLHYCNRYEAKCVLPTDRVDKKSNLHSKWDKLYHISNTLKTTPVEWLLWMDCDAAFTNFEIDWYIQFKPYLNSSQLMVVSKDQGGINLGVFLVPNTPNSLKFIEDMYQLRHQLEHKFFHKDQSALKHLMQKNPQIESQLEIVPQKLINTYFDNDAGEVWMPYDFIMHQVFCLDVVGCSANFTKVMKKVTPQF